MSTERTPTSDASPTVDETTQNDADASPTVDETTQNDADATPDPTAPATDVASRGRSDPWAAPDESGTGPVVAGAPRQFEPACRRRLSNLVDHENAYSG